MKRKKQKIIVIVLLVLILLSLLIFGVLELLAQTLWKKDSDSDEPSYPQSLIDSSLREGDSLDGEMSKIKIRHYDVSYEEVEGEVYFSGRWFAKSVKGQEAMVTVTQGAMMYFKVQGATSVDLCFVNNHDLETPYFAYIIDGGEPIRQQITDSIIPLPDAKTHVVQVVIDGITEREDKWSGEKGVAFTGLICDGDVVAVKPQQKRILFYGDSITEGIMTLSGNAISDYNSSTHAFSWYTAQMLNAEPYFIGYGSTGIINTGSFATTYDSLNYLSQTRTISENDLPDCDLIVLEVGTNDFGVTPDVFVPEYQKVIETLHERYPEVSILCIVPFIPEHAEDVADAISQYDYCTLVDTSQWEITYSDEIEVHPDDNGSRYIANELARIAVQGGYVIE